MCTEQVEAAKVTEKKKEEQPKRACKHCVGREEIRSTKDPVFFAFQQFIGLFFAFVFLHGGVAEAWLEFFSKEHNPNNPHFIGVLLMTAASLCAGVALTLVIKNFVSFVRSNSVGEYFYLFFDDKNEYH